MTAVGSPPVVPCPWEHRAPGRPSHHGERQPAPGPPRPARPPAGRGGAGAGCCCCCSCPAPRPLPPRRVTGASPPGAAAASAAAAAPLPPGPAQPGRTLLCASLAGSRRVAPAPVAHRTPRPGHGGLR